MYVLACLLLLCLFKMPYGYYQLVRYLTFGVFAYLAYQEYKTTNELSKAFWIYLLTAILFQPFIKIALGKTIWNIVDIIVAVGLNIDASRKRIVN